MMVDWLGRVGLGLGLGSAGCFGWRWVTGFRVGRLLCSFTFVVLVADCCYSRLLIVVIVICVYEDE